MSQNPPPTDLPSPESAMQMLAAAKGQICFARDYVQQLLDATPVEHWYTIPDGCHTHIAWQMGHLTVSQYGLLMFRLRGRHPDDLELMPGKFRKGFSRGSTPKPDPADNPSIDDLKHRFATVFETSCKILEAVTAEVLMQPIEMPFAVYPTNLGGILFCPLHEQIHAGQIGMIRRGLGLAPVR